MVNEVINSVASPNIQASAARVTPKTPAPQEVKVVKEAEASVPTRQTNAADGTELPVKPATAEDKGTPEDLASLMKRMQDYVENYDRDLHFSLDEESGRTIIKVIDPETEELVRQIPQEEVLEVARALENNGGLMPEAKA